MDKAVALLEKLAEKLGTTVEYLWGVLLKQAPVSSICIIVEWIVLGLFTYGCYLLVRKAQLVAEDRHWDDIWYVFPVIGGIIILILWGLAISCISDMVTGFVNPEYWALKEVLRTVAPK